MSVMFNFEHPTNFDFRFWFYADFVQLYYRYIYYKRHQHETTYHWLTRWRVISQVDVVVTVECDDSCMAHTELSHAATADTLATVTTMSSSVTIVMFQYHQVFH